MNRVISLLNALRTYFVHYLPKKRLPDLERNERYQRLRSVFASEKTDVYLCFLSEVLPLFQEMQYFLQRDDPIGPHYVYKISGMMASLGGRFLLPSVCEDIAVSKIESSTTSPSNHCSDIDIGYRTNRSCLKNMNNSEIVIFKLEVKSFYLEAFKVITKSLKLDDKEHMKLWRKLTLLCPQNRAFTSEKDMKSKWKSVVYLAQLTPSYIKSDNIQPLIEEWKQLAIEDGIESHEEERLDVHCILAVYTVYTVYWIYTGKGSSR